MQKYTLITLLAICIALTGCKKNSGGVWDDNKTASHFKDKEGKSMWGEELSSSDELLGPTNSDFIPLRDEDLKAQFADGGVPQSKIAPGDAGSGLPTIDLFRNPAAALASIFSTVYFNTDDHIIRGDKHFATIDRVSDYLKAHPNTYVFIEGHCDERGPESYNLSLGARRANYVRTLLVQKGVNLNQVHTVSYGKERPIELGHNTQAWSKNRRAQFKIYEK